jgi:multidrug efflux pump subunit AcrB
LFLSFAVFDSYFDQGGYAAFILLGGLVVNSVVFILNDFNQLKRKTNRAFIKVVAAKTKPITLTLLSTCLGLVPFLIGGENEVFWFALAIGTIGGLIISVITTMVFLPVILFNEN